MTERSLKSCYQDESSILASAIKERSGLYEKETDKRNPCIYFPSLDARLWTLDTRSSGRYFKQPNPFINTKGVSGSDAIILESNGHYALIDMGEDYDFPDGSNPRYPSRVGISTNNEYVLEDRLFRHMQQLGIKKLDFILGTHVHSDHIGICG